MKSVLQLALDFVDLKRALKSAQAGIAGGVDWLEAGTPLIKSEGLHAVRELRKLFPNITIVADMKIMDAGRTEVETAAKAGANIVDVLGASSDATVRECIQAGKNYGAKIVVDMIAVDDVLSRAKQVEDFGCDYVSVHCAIDEQMEGKDPFDVLRQVSEALSIPVAVAGGINSETAARAVEAGAAIVIVGGAITKAMDPEQAAREIRQGLDTGKSISTSSNADAFGIDLSRIDKIVLSHGHFDHTGGLRQVLTKMRKEVEIIAHPDIWRAKYGRREGEKDRYIGVPFLRQELESFGAIFNLTVKPVIITDNVMTTGEVPMVTEFEQIDPTLFVKEDDGFKPDKLMDDQALIINTESGLIVILGCGHRGVINTLYHVQQLTGVNPIHMVMGGFHLVRASEEQVWLTIAALKELNVQRVGASHCTELPAAAIMAQGLGDELFFNNTGTIINLP